MDNERLLNSYQSLDQQLRSWRMGIDTDNKWGQMLCISMLSLQRKRGQKGQQFGNDLVQEKMS